MMIDEMGIRLIDEHDVADFNRKGKKARPMPVALIPAMAKDVAHPVVKPKKPQPEEEPGRR